MSINYEIYGAPETWHDCYYGGGSTAAWVAMLHGEKAKVPTWALTEGTPDFVNSQLRSAVDDNKLTPTEPIDNSICAVGQGKASPFRQFTVFRCDGTAEHQNGEILQVGHAYTGANYNDNNTVNTFWFESNCNSSYGNYGNGAFSRGRLSIRDGATITQGLDQRIWSPTGVNSHGTNKQNGNFYIAPFMSYGTRSYVLQIWVWVTKADYTNDFVPGSGTPDGEWKTLDNWKNNFPTKAITACLLTPRSLTSYNSSTGIMGYSRVSYESSQYRKVASGILDEIKFEFDDGYTIPNLTDYGLFSSNSNSNVGIALFNEMTLYKWSDTLQAVGIVNSQIASYIRSNGTFMTPYIPYSDDIYEWIMEACACFGMAFTPAKAKGIDASNCQFNQAFTDPDLCLPIIDANGIANGEYTRGADNLDNDFIDLKSQWDKEYDPAKPSAPIPSGDPIYPFSPGLTLAGAGTGLWAMSRADIKETINDIFGGESEKLKDKLTLFGNNPMNAIISLKWYPMTFNSTVKGPVILGTVKVNNSHTYPVINSTANSLYENNGSLNIMNAYERNFYNSRNIQARLWLPFYGFYELPTSILLSKQIELTLHYNLPDELAIWIISFDNVIYDYCECAMGIDIPLTGSNAAAISEAKRQAALQIASQITTTAATIATGIAGIKVAAATAGAIQSIGLGAGLGIGEALDGEVVGGEMLVRGTLHANQSFNTSKRIGSAAAGLGSLAGGTGILGTIHQTRLDIANLRTNIPFHGAAGQTTFLNLPMYPYIQIFRNNIMSIYNEDEYKLKVGHACDVWKNLTQMPDNSFLQTTGCANMSSMGMELQEYQELNSILQTGFFK